MNGIYYLADYFKANYEVMKKLFGHNKNQFFTLEHKTVVSNIFANLSEEQLKGKLPLNMIRMDFYKKNPDRAFEILVPIVQSYAENLVIKRFEKIISDQDKQLESLIYSIKRKTLLKAKKESFIITKDELKDYLKESLNDYLHENPTFFNQEIRFFILQHFKKNTNPSDILQGISYFLTIAKDLSDQFSNDDINDLLAKLIQHYEKDFDFNAPGLHGKLEELVKKKIIKSAEKQDLKNAHFFSKPGFFNSIHTKDKYYQNLIIPLLNGISLLLTSDAEGAKILFDKWRIEINNLSILWANCIGLNYTTPPDNELGELLRTILKVQKILFKVAQSGVFTKGFLDEVLKLDFTNIDISKPLGLNFENIDNKIDELEDYFNDSKIAIFFHSDSQVQKWPESIQFALVLIVGEIRRYIKCSLTNEGFRLKLINSAQDFLNIFDSRLVKNIVNLTGDKTIDTALLMIKFTFLNKIKPDSELKYLEKEHKSLIKNKKPMVEWIVTIKKELEKLENKKKATSFEIKEMEDQRDNITTQQLSENKDKPITWFINLKEKKEELESNISWSNNEFKTEKRDIFLKQKNLTQGLKKLEELDLNLDDVSRSLNEAATKNRIIFDENLRTFINTFLQDLFNSVYQLDFDTKYKTEKVRDFHLYEIFSLLLGSTEILNSLTDYLKTINDYSLARMQYKEQIEKKEKLYNQMLDKYLSQFPRVIQQLASVIKKNLNHQSLVKVFDEVISDKIKHIPFTSLENQSFIEWLISAIGEPLKEMK